MSNLLLPSNVRLVYSAIVAYDSKQTVGVVKNSVSSNLLSNYFGSVRNATLGGFKLPLQENKPINKTNSIVYRFDLEGKTKY